MALSASPQNLLRLFLTFVCPGCGGRRGENEYLCPWCRQRIDPCRRVHWSRTGASFNPVSSPGKSEELSSGISIYSAALYRGLPREIVLRIKFNGEKYLARVAAEMILRNSIAIPEADDILVPVPAGSKRIRERGYNQSHLIAEALASRVGAKNLNLLCRGDGRSQVGLSVAERRSNVRGVFSLRKRRKVPTDVHIWLIDDVATTCSTLDSASEILLKSGAESVTGLTLTYRKQVAGSIV